MSCPSPKPARPIFGDCPDDPQGLVPDDRKGGLAGTPPDVRSRARITLLLKDSIARARRGVLRPRVVRSVGGDREETRGTAPGNRGDLWVGELQALRFTDSVPEMAPPLSAPAKLIVFVTVPVTGVASASRGTSPR